MNCLSAKAHDWMDAGQSLTCRGHSSWNKVAARIAPGATKYGSARAMRRIDTRNCEALNLGFPVNRFTSLATRRLIERSRWSAGELPSLMLTPSTLCWRLPIQDERNRRYGRIVSGDDQKALAVARDGVLLA